MNNSTLYPQREVGGLYRHPLSLWSVKRSCPSSALILSLKPPGHSTCEVLKYIVNYIFTVRVQLLVLNKCTHMVIKLEPF